MFCLTPSCFSKECKQIKRQLFIIVINQGLAKHFLETPGARGCGPWNNWKHEVYSLMHLQWTCPQNLDVFYLIYFFGLWSTWGCAHWVEFRCVRRNLFPLWFCCHPLLLFFKEKHPNLAWHLQSSSIAATIEGTSCSPRQGSAGRWRGSMTIFPPGVPTAWLD